MKLYTTRNDAIAREIVSPIEDGGEIENAYDQFDIDAIADEVLEYVDGYDSEQNAYFLNRQGFRLREDIEADDFWDSAMRHAM